MSDGYDQNSTATTSASGDTRTGDLSGANNLNAHDTPVIPNPVRQDSTVSAAVQSAQSVTAAAYNTLSQRVAPLYNGAASDLTILRVGVALPSGIHFLHVDGESSLQSGSAHARKSFHQS